MHWFPLGRWIYFQCRVTREVYDLYNGLCFSFAVRCSRLNFAYNFLCWKAYTLLVNGTTFTDLVGYWFGFGLQRYTRRSLDQNMQGWVHGLCCPGVLLQYWKDLILSGWWRGKTLVCLFTPDKQESRLFFLFHIVWFEHSCSEVVNIHVSLDVRVERIYREVNSSIMEGSLVITLSLKKLPVVLSRFTALTGLLVTFLPYSIYFFW